MKNKKTRAILSGWFFLITFILIITFFTIYKLTVYATSESNSLAFAWVPLDGPSEIRGVVTNEKGEPLANRTICVNGYLGRWDAETDLNGYFYIYCQNDNLIDLTIGDDDRYKLNFNFFYHLKGARQGALLVITIND